MHGTLGISLLGIPEVATDTRTVALSPREAGLIAILAVNSKRPESRHRLVRLLWPESNESAARHNLSQVVYGLKRKAGVPVVIPVGRDELTLARSTADIRGFLEAIAIGDWHRAAALYRGPFLSTVGLGGSALDDWVVEQRSEFDRCAIQVLEGLKVENATAPAKELAGRITAVPPLETASDWSSRVPSVESEQDTSSESIFVGRVELLARIERAFHELGDRGTSVVVLEGEAGIGKTSVVDRFARKRVLRGDNVLMARGFPAERNVPFGVADQLLRCLRPRILGDLENSWLGILAETFPGAVMEVPAEADKREPGGALVGEYRVLEALRQLVITLAKRGPAVIVVDDAQYADSATLEFLHYFRTRSPLEPILVLSTVRTPSQTGHDPFGDWHGITRVVVEGLAPAEVEALATRVLGPDTLDSGELQAISDRAGRNPLLVASLLTSKRVSTDIEVPERVVDFFGPSLARVPREANLLLAAQELGGAAIDLAERIAGIPSALAVIPELEREGLVELTSDGRLVPRHGIVTEVALQRLSAADRKAMHGRAARILSDEGRAPPAVLAIQHDMAGDRQAAFDTALQAAAASEKLYAAREQEFFLKIALINARDPESRHEIRLRLCGLYVRLRRFEEAMDVVDGQFMSTARPAMACTARAMRLRARLNGRLGDDLLRNAQKEMADLRECISPELYAGLLVALAVAANDLSAGRLGATASEQALLILRGVPMHGDAVVTALLAAALVGIQQDVETGFAEMERLEPFSATTPTFYAYYLTSRGSLLMKAGKLKAAEEALAEALALAEQYLVLERLPANYNNLGLCYLEQGMYEQAAIKFHETVGTWNLIRTSNAGDVATDNLAALYYEQGRYDEALGLSTRWMNEESGHLSRRLFSRLGLAGLVLLELGQLGRAQEAYREVLLLLEQHDYWGTDFSYTEIFLARMLALEGRADAARERLHTAIEVYRRRDVLARARLELELARMDLRTDPAAAGVRAAEMLDVLRGSGARPLIERFEEVADSARIRAARQGSQSASGAWRP